MLTMATLFEKIKGAEQIKDYRIRLNEIVSNFNAHKSEIELFPKDLNEMGERMKYFIEKISIDQKSLRVLKNEIKYRISEKQRSITGVAESIASGIYGVFGSRPSSTIDLFQDLLNEAIEQEKKIQDLIDKMINELSQRMEELPQFHENPPSPFISTHFY